METTIVGYPTKNLLCIYPRVEASKSVCLRIEGSWLMVASRTTNISISMYIYILTNCTEEPYLHSPEKTMFQVKLLLCFALHGLVGLFLSIEGGEDGCGVEVCGGPYTLILALGFGIFFLSVFRSYFDGHHKVNIPFGVGCKSQTRPNDRPIAMGVPGLLRQSFPPYQQQHHHRHHRHHPPHPSHHASSNHLQRDTRVLLDT